MSWKSVRSKYKDFLEDYVNSYSGSKVLAEQISIFSTHLNDLKKVARRVDSFVRNGELKENFPVMTLFYESPWPVRCLEMLFIVLRDDGFVYFGRDEAIAILGLGGRFKDCQFEFYDQYKDQIDA